MRLVASQCERSAGLPPRLAVDPVGLLLVDDKDTRVVNQQETNWIDSKARWQASGSLALRSN